MKRSGIAALALLALAIPAAQAQPSESAAQSTGLGEVMVSGNRLSAPYAQQDRPVIGLRRRADSAVMTLYISSDTRDAAIRTQEIYTVLLAAMDKASAAGLELVSGGVPIQRVTRDNYKLLPLMGAGRVDTSQVQLLVKARLEGTAGATEARLRTFIAGLKGTGRATIGTPGGIALTVIDPDQYRETIVRLVAEEAKRNAAMFGPEFSYHVTGIDGQLAWSQVSPSEVMLYIPYRYTILPKR
jgi:hypothetical protein